ncbi:non-ribosomal peptide synthase/polyketide synthase [Amycolatopsis samaneae]|uniref:Non-ribosomal peptide synthase/polyketide synthase n=1 Tax=Amycolatopsis samaneae TaxID=664691 RepID=A0ABW5GRK2_9PSEU
MDTSSSHAERLANLPEHLREAALRRLAGNAAAPAERIPAVDRNGPLPLSFAQQRLWFLHEFEPDSHDYNTVRVLRLRGPVDVAAVRAALTGLVARHESLRTVFRAEDGRASQIVLPATDVALSVVEAPESDVDSLLTEEAARPFDLRTGPLLRASLVSSAEDEHVLALSMHHIVTDGWSMGVLAEELGALYSAAVRGGSAELPALPVGYGDYAAWQRARTTELDTRLDYWRAQLAGLVPLELPTDRPRPTVRSSRGSALGFAVPGELVSGLRALARDHGASLFMVLTAAVQVLLARYSGERDVAVGTVTSGRSRPELERLVGFFVNTVVLRSTVEGSFTDLMTRVRATVLDAFAHDEVPFERVVDALDPGRDLSRTPLVQAMVVLQNAPDRPLDLPGVRVEELDPPCLTAAFDLTVEFRERAAGLAGTLNYSTELFDEDTMRRLAEHLLVLLRGILADPGRAVDDLPLLAPAELDRVTIDWNDTARAYPAELSVHEVFQRRVRRAPDATALVFDDRRVTYGELNARANQVAHHLLSLGIGRGSLVGLCVERGPGLVIGLLGILKAGAGYVPLDPAYPDDRLAYLITDTGTSVVVTDAALASRFPDPLTPVRLDEDLPVLASYPAEDPHSDAGGGDVLCVMYTSGTSGLPKGVVSEHRAVLRTFLGTDFIDFGPDQVFLSTAPVSWDAFLLELWPALLHGGTCVFQPGQTPDPDRIEDLVARHGVTTLWLSAGLFNFMVDNHPAVFRGVRQVMTGGEAASAGHVDRARRRFPWLRLVNGYGPVESMVFATTHEIRTPAGTATSIPIGRPIANTRVYVLDSRHSPVPIGLAGEVYLGGDGLARGYLNQPELTARRFVRLTVGGRSERLYRTGDLARWLPGGELEFLGRADEQVKIRGFRVEPAEVEAALLRHPGLAAAAVVATEEAASHRRLVAYLVGVDGARPDPGEVRAFLDRELPGYLVPSVLMPVDALPRTANGKLDRSALPAPEARAVTGFVAPRDEVERVLAEVWAEVLGVERVGVEDNFFELGGDSILSLQVVAAARRHGLRLTSKELFRRQTVAALATDLSVADTTRLADRSTVVGEAPLTPIQRWFFETVTETPEHFTQSVFLELTEDVDEAALRAAVAALLAHHDALRMRFEPAEGTWRQHNPEAETHEVFRRIAASTVEEMARHALAAQSGMDLTGGPLVRVLLFDRARLFIAAHHLVVDGVSWRVLVSDLESAYHQALAGAEIDLGEKTTSFLDWARRLERHAATGALEGELEYWTNHGSEPLPVDHVGANTVGSARSVSVSLGVAETDSLLHKVPGAFRTQINDVLLTALGRVLSEWTGRARVAVVLEGHGREELFDDVDVSRTVGWFTSLFPLALDVPAADWGTTVKSVKEQLRAVPQRGFGYGALRYLAGAAELAADPYPRISFNYHGQLDFDGGDTRLVRGRLPGIGRDHHADLIRPNLLDVVGMVEGGRLEFVWSYSANVHDEATIATLAERFVAALGELVAFCADGNAGGCTPSDFPLVSLTQDQVDLLVGSGREVEDVYPLTPTQSGMLFHSLVESGNGVYFNQICVALDGIPDPEVFGRAWQCVVDRVPVLRSSVVWDGVPEPVQVVHRDVSLPITHLDWRHLTETEQRHQFDFVVEHERKQGADLSTPPLLRVVIARTSDTGVRLGLVFHHILLDGWSLGQVVDDLFTCYAALHDGEQPEPSRRRPFRDHVAWLRGQDLALAEAHWRRELAGFESPTRLPFDRPAVDAHGTYSGGRTVIELSEEDSRRLFDWAREHRLTVNAVVEGAWAVLLSRYSGDREVCFGTTVAGRPADVPGVESMVGMFINTLPVRVPVDGDRDLVSWLRAVRDRAVDSRQFDYVSLAQAQSWSETTGSLFDSLVTSENYPFDEGTAELQGIRTVEVAALESTNYPLSVNAHAGRRLELLVRYDEAVFDASTVERLGAHLHRLLREIIAGAERVADLTMLTEPERRDLADWNDTGHEIPDTTLPALFAEQVRRTPDAVAVVFDGAALTYRELDERADRLAHVLAGRGAGPDVLVGVLLHRGFDLVVALLGIHKAGAAYLPLDPDYPMDRLEFMVADSGAPIIVTDARLRDRLADRGSVVCVDETPAGPVPPAPTPLPAHAAYCIYTSGSTGRPKGVVISHAAVVNRLLWMQAEYRLTAEDRVLQKTPSSSDISVWEFFWPLIVGATLVVARPEGHRDPAYLARVIREERVSTVHFVPSMLRAFVAEPTAAGLPSLRRVLASGEALPADLRDAALLVLGAPLHNLYGPTEAAVDVTSWACRAGTSTVPIGRPLWNTEVHVLDGDLRQVPVGVPGELYLAGVQLARGYHGRAGLTAERFVANPFAPGGRMYRTGDLARWAADGSVEYLGRTDDQVKIRGFRIELGEIEAVLTQHPDVTAAAVVLRDGRLVAYLTGPAGDVRPYLAERLPEHMVPATFVRLDTMPLTPAGKTDRRALPTTEVEPDTGYVAPRTEVERALADIWAEALGVRRVGVADDFFALGGDSLLSIRVLSRVRAKFGVGLSPRALFDARTVGAFAVTVAGSHQNTTDPIVPVDRTGPLPLSFGQQRLWFLDEFRPGGVEYNSVAGVRMRGTLDVDRLASALTTLVARHESLRTTFDSVDGRGVQIVRPPFDLALARADLTGAEDQESRCEDILAAEIARPFELRTGPLIRAKLIRMSATDHILVLVLHHIVTDGWSMGVLADELGALYESRTLDPLPVQYPDFAVWQRERLSGEVGRRLLDYWRERLAGIAPLELPTDRPRSTVATADGATARFQVPADVVTRLKRIGQEHDATLFMVLVAATQVVLGRWSGQRDVAVGTASSGRGRSELEGLVGFFVNTLVLRSDVDGALSFGEFLDQVRGTVLDAFAHDEVPFEWLVDELVPVRDPGRDPLVQARVIMQNTPMQGLGLGDLRLSELNVRPATAINELLVNYEERDGAVTGVISYRTGLFDESTMERMAGHLRVLLAGIADDPARTVGALPLMTRTERQALTTSSTGPEQAVPHGLSVHRLVEEQVVRSPGAVAVVCGDESLSYAELDARANRLARFLIGRGVGRDVLVGLCFERSLDAVVGMLGVLKAGGAYVPLDPAYPADRLAFMVRDARPALVLTQQGLAGRFEVPVVSLDTDGEEIARYPETAPEVPVVPGDAAYVIYTSGSSGVPKGVVVEHRSVVDYLSWTGSSYSGAAGRVLVHSSFSFDLTVTGLFTPLTVGGCAVLGALDESDVTAGSGCALLKGTPSHLPMLTALPAGYSPTEQLLLGGEALVGEALNEWRAAHPSVTVLNVYGPTEATVNCAEYRIEPGQEVLPGPVPFGRPQGNARLYVLDALLRPVPVGVAGELYISGAGLARGYLNRAGLTAERFVADPFVAGERMYRSGDLARWNADGELVFAGRADDQVKVRGYRIELGEVEAALVARPGVSGAAVIVRDDRLVAYVVSTVDVEDVRASVANVLPAYMVPSVFVVLDRLPLTTHGKLDRTALPEPETTAKTGYVAPRNDIEQTLADLWAEVLGVERVGVEDNFFELGGDSILSIQVIARARRVGLRFTSQQLFLRQTIAALAPDVAVDVVATADDRSVVAGEVPLTPIQRWFFETVTEDRAHFNQSVYVDLVDGVDEGALRSAVAAVVAQHDALRMRFARADGVWRQENAAVESADVLVRVEVSSVEDEENAIAVAQRGLELRAGPLLRAVLVNGERLFVVVHHLVVDGVSWRILLGDLETAYRQAAEGREIDLGSKTTSFRDWARRLETHAAAGGFDDQLGWWSEVRGAELPVDHAGANTVGSARSVSVSLGEAETDALLHQVPAVYRTQINDVLLTALGRVLADWTGRDRVAVELEGHGREELFDDVDVSRTVGWFTTRYPIVLDVPATDWGTTVKSVKEQLRSVPQRGFGYGALRYLRTADALAKTPYPQISFNYLGQFAANPGDGLYRGFRPAAGGNRAEGQLRPRLLDVVGTVEDGRLEFVWSYSSNIHDEATITAVAREFAAALGGLVAHCAEENAGGCTPSDFPLVSLTQDQVDGLVGAGREVEDVYPLTPTQSGMLFHSLAESEAGAYFNQASVALDGIPDPEVFGRAWQCVVDRVPVLRSSVVWDGVPEPVQVVRREVRLPITQLDWRHLDDAGQGRELASYLERDRAARLDFAAAPLARLAVARLTDTRIRFVWTCHHILLDGWSTAQVLAEVFVHYFALRGEDRHPAHTRPPFRDYVAWLREQDPALAEAYWRRELAGFASPTRLPFDRVPFEAHQARSASMLSILLSEVDSQRLYEWAREHRLTVNAVIEGAWAVLLSQYSGDRAVCFGATVAGRPAEVPGIESMVGLFINTLPVRVAVDDDRDLVSWLRALQDRLVESRRFEYSSLAQVQSWAGVPGGSLFDSIVVFENFPVDEGSVTERGIEVVDVVAGGNNNFPLTLNAHADQRLRLRLYYDRDLFDPATIDRLGGHLRRVLEQMVASPSSRPADLTVVSADEARELTVGNAGPAMEVRAGLSVHRLVEEQVVRSPGAVAVVCGNESLSYAELDARANRLARFLIGRGVGRGVLVGLCFERSLDAVVGMLGVLKAGGAYVPLDPEYPADRLAFMVGDARPAMVLTQQRLAGRFEVPVVSLDTDWDQVAGYPDTAPDITVDRADAAYVIYTSGSSGVPKGVVVEHRSVVDYLTWTGSAYSGAADRVLVHSSFSFDLTVTGLFTPLTVGGCVVLAALDESESVEAGCSLLKGTPSHLPMLTALPERFSPTEQLLLGGEALVGEALTEWRAAHPSVTVLNVYGPTEATVNCAEFRIEPGQEIPSGPVPFGRPQGNARLYVLDASLRPVPVGVAGELYLAGEGLARGYLNRASLTAERFVADPFVAGERMYRSGDLARWNADGELVFAGRADDQVKVRGYRIELGEVEAALTAHPGVSSAVVVVRDDRLVAYVVSTVDTEDVRASVANVLPAYMVPSAFVVLDRLPLTTHGKVDREALPEPEVVAKAGYVAPRNDVELTLSEVWAEVLEVERVGVEDNFFELGGDSILGILVMSRVKAAFGTVLSPRALFEVSTVAGLAELVARSAGAGAEDIPVVDRTEPLPLSFGQQRLWFLNEFQPDGVEYNNIGAVRMHGELEPAVLSAALDRLVARHEALRTTFDAVDGRGVQLVHPRVRVPIVEVDLSARPVGERARELDRELAAEVALPFDLRNGPLVRAKLVRLSDVEHVFVLAMHHIVTDGWSMGVLTGELSTLYSAGIRGEEATLDPLPVQYPDFAVWQRERLSGAMGRRLLEYWRERLAGIAPLELPIDRPRPAVKTTTGAQHVFVLPGDLLAGLRRVARGQDATLFMMLVAATQVVLSRWSGQRDVAIGTASSGRGRPELEGLVGFFVNTLVLRSDVDPILPFSEFLGQVRGTVLDAFAHDEVPFEWLVDELVPVRDPGRDPLVQARVIMQNAPMRDLDLAGLRLEDLRQPRHAAMHELLINYQESGDTLLGAVTYNSDLFDAATIERLAGHLRVLLARIVAAPETPVGDLPVLSETETRELTVGRAGPRLPVRGDVGVHGLVEEQAVRSPGAVAVLCGNESLTYAELDARANRLAHFLIGRGVGRDVLVGLCFERSLDAVVGMLGVLKAGGAYVPLDPEYPADRLAFMVGDARPALVLTQQRLAKRFDVPVVSVDSERSRIEDCPDHAPGTAVVPGDAAYVIYTSGSSGVPKGVVVEHRSVVDYLTWTGSAYSGAAGRVLVHSSFSFDLTVTGLFTPLTVGGCVVLAALDESESVDAGCSLLKGTPSHLPMLTALPPEFSPTAELLLGGEALVGEALTEWRAAHPSVAVLNVYGPTEATVNCAEFRIEPGQEVAAGPVPFGRPQGNARLYVLDALLRPVPVGVVGELYISGGGLARGYLNRASLTAERFVADPFVTGERMYRSGDLARWNSAGELVFAGRADDQVKVRGYRIELGEVEAALTARPGVSSAVVVVRDDRLVAYVVSTVDTEDLRSSLVNVLPAYMVPAAFVALDRLPLTTHGKVDRDALPEPEAVAKAGYVAPRNDTEQTLADLWAEVLGVERVGVEDNFFELGGDSILSIQVIARARRVGLRFTSQQLFLRQTIAALVPDIVVEQSRQPDRAPVTGDVPLTPIQRWFFETVTEDRAHFNQSVYVDLVDGVDEGALRSAVAAVVAQHDALRMRFARADGVWRQQNLATESDEVFAAVEVPSAEDEQDAVTVAQRGLDLTAGPLLRAVLVNGERLFVVVHHLVVDGVSWRILLGDLETAYRQVAEGREIDLGSKTTSFRDWARRLETHVAAGELDRQLGHWANVAATAPTDIPIDHRRGANTVESAEVVSAGLTESETHALVHQVPAMYRTQINDVLLTALGRVLADWTGRDRVAVELEGHGREELFDDVDVSRTVGWFTTRYPIVLDVPPDDWRTVVRAVRRQLRAIPDRGLGYGALRYLRGTADRVTPQVSFNYLGQLDATITEDSPLYRASLPAPGGDRAPSGIRPQPIGVLGRVYEGRLRVDWVYSGNLHRRDTIARLADRFVEALRQIVEDGTP